MSETTNAAGGIGVLRGAALYVGALMGPGLLLVPSLAVHAAGPAAIVAWAALLAPVGAAGDHLRGARRAPSGGTAASTAYVAARGSARGRPRSPGTCFLTAVPVGAPAVALDRRAGTSRT